MFGSLRFAREVFLQEIPYAREDSCKDEAANEGDRGHTCIHRFFGSRLRAAVGISPAAISLAFEPGDSATESHVGIIVRLKGCAAGVGVYVVRITGDAIAHFRPKQEKDNTKSDDDRNEDEFFHTINYSIFAYWKWAMGTAYV